MAVEDRLAVLDPLGQAPRRHRLPPFGLGQLAGGREANRAFWAAFFTAFPDLTATLDDLVMAGDRVAGRFTYRGTHRGPLLGIPPTGRPAEMRSIDIWRVAGREFAEHWDELNLLEVFQQLGVIPAPGPGGQEHQS